MLYTSIKAQSDYLIILHSWEIFSYLQRELQDIYMLFHLNSHMIQFHDNINA